MSQPDVVSEVLTYLTDGSGTQENWETANHDPAPILFNGNDHVRQDTGDRVKGVDLTENNVITVDASPPTTQSPIGTEYDHDLRIGAGVTIEGLHRDAGGEIADDDDFNSLVTEARRAILSERRFPVGNMTHLLIEEENNESPTASRAETNHFEYTFTVWFEGFETLP